MNIYQIDAKYLEKCNKIDMKSIRKNTVVCGVVLDINQYKYFAPLTIAKESKRKLCSKTVVKLFEKKDKKKEYMLGAIRLNNMVPCKKEHLQLLRISEINDPKYRILRKKQFEIINYKESENIENKAKKLYNEQITKRYSFTSRLCCDFKKLEAMLDLENEI